MANTLTDYTAWRSIDYRPAVESLPPTTLIPFLTPGARVLDIGCGRGETVLFLARLGMAVTGVDISEPAVAEAAARAFAAQVAGTTDVHVADILDDRLALADFDAVIMTRVLTCFPELDLWRKLLARARFALKASGILYVHDFLLDETDPQYAARYAAGLRDHLRYGSFHVHGPRGRRLFVAHHHSDAELAEIADPYDAVLLERHAGVSMHGHACLMFEFIGRRCT
jgi:SAM-dependent methyltransferase